MHMCGHVHTLREWLMCSRELSIDNVESTTTTGRMHTPPRWRRQPMVPFRVVFIIPLLQGGCAEGGPADDSTASRSLRRGEGKQHGDTGGNKGLHGDDTGGVSSGGPKAAAAAATATAGAPPPALSSTSAGCCWSFDDKAKRYQYYVRPANAACVAPYKPAACPGAASPPSAAASGQAGPATVSSPPPPPVPSPLAMEPTAVPSQAAASTAPRPLHEKPHESAKAQAKAAANAKAAAEAAAAATAATSSPPPAASPSGLLPKSGASSSSGGGGDGYFGMIVFLGGSIAACVFRKQLKETMAAYFPTGDELSSSTVTPAAKGKKYKAVGPKADDEQSISSNTCGLSGDEEVDPVAEEWAARLAAQREGREYTPSSASCAVVVGGGMPALSGCGAGPVPSFGGSASGGSSSGGAPFQTPPYKPAEEDGGFDGFGGFEEEVDERGGWGNNAGPAASMGGGGMGGGGMDGGGMGGGGMGGGGMGMGGGGMGGGGMGGASQVPAANWGDLGLLAQPGGLGGATIDYGELEKVGQPQQQADDLDWGILSGGGGGGRGASSSQPTGGHADASCGLAGHDEDEDDIPIFDGFQDNKPVLGGGGGGRHGGGTSSGEGLSWDAERGLWKESKPRSAFSSMGSNWDLRGSSFKSPASLMRLRSQAEKVFDDAVSNSIFTSPSMQRFKKQTDDMLATLSTYVPLPTTIFKDTKSFFSSWFS